MAPLRCIKYLIILASVSLLLMCPSLHAQDESGNRVTFRDLLPASSSGMVISHTYYSLSYSEEHEQAEWVCFELTPDFINGNQVADGILREDKAIRTGSAVPEDYLGTTYLPGMLCPPDMMKLNETSMSETFLMSNTTPVKENFMLKHLEEVVKSWVIEEGRIIVVAGAILTSGLPKIGANGISVPRKFYKIVLDTTGEMKMIAFAIPANAGNRPIGEFVVSVDYLEDLLQMDFFPGLDDSLEESLEISADFSAWNYTFMIGNVMLEPID